MNERSRFIRYAVATLLVGASSLMGVRDAGAIEYKVVAAAACRPYSTADQSKLLFLQNSVQNLNESMSAQVLCPLPKEDYEGKEQENGGMAVYGVAEKNGEVSCTVTIGDGDPISAITITKSKPVLSKEKWFLEWDLVLSNETELASATVKCRLPPKALLTRIVWVQD